MGAARSNDGGPETWLLPAIDQVAASDPERLAHVAPSARMTYGALRARSLALASAVERAAGGNTGPVLVYGHKEPEMIAAFVACARAGRAYVPADVSAPPARVARMCHLAGAAAAIAAAPLPADLAAGLEQAGIPVVPGGTCGTAVPAGLRTPDSRAYIIFTSGTTGDPKGVPIPWSALRHFTGWMLREQRVREGAEVILNQAPFSFDLSVMDLYLCLLTGGTLFSVTHGLVANPRALFAALGASSLTVWVSTPSFARFCVAERSFGAAMLPGLRRLLFCGEPLPTGLARELLRRFPEAELWNTYGPTETTVAVTSVRIRPEMVATDTALPVGRAAPGMRVWVGGADLRPVPDGERGEVVIAGPQVSTGYIGAPPDADARFIRVATGDEDDPAYRTGDAGRVVNGLLYCEGRLDRQIKLHGYRLELDEIEAHLRRLPGVADSAVLPATRQGVLEYLVAFVSLEPAHPWGDGTDFERASALRNALGRSLPPYAVPRLVRFLEAVPMTGNGKVDRRALEALL